MLGNTCLSLVSSNLFINKMQKNILVKNRSPKLHTSIEILRFFTNLVEAVYVGVQLEALKLTRKSNEPDVYQYIWVSIVLFVCGCIIQLFGGIYTITMIVKRERAYRRMVKSLSQTGEEESNKKLIQQSV